MPGVAGLAACIIRCVVYLNEVPSQSYVHLNTVSTQVTNTCFIFTHVYISVNPFQHVYNKYISRHLKGFYVQHCITVDVAMNFIYDMNELFVINVLHFPICFSAVLTFAQLSN